MFKKILLPLDSSELAERAISTGLAIAKQTNATLTLVRVAEPVVDKIARVGGLGWLAEKDELKEAVKVSDSYLRNVVDELDGDLDVQTAVLNGRDIANAIIEYVGQHDIDLIVMSSHGRTGLRRWAYGSIATRLMSSAPCPMLVLRDSFSAERILITLDGSELSEKIIDPVKELAKVFDSSTILFHAMDSTRPKLQLSKPESYLYSFAKEWNEEGLVCETMVTWGETAKSILNYLENQENRINLVALSTHGMSGILRWPFGRVAMRVINYSPTSIFIVPSNSD